VIPTQIELDLDCRLLPGETTESWLVELQGVLGDDCELAVVGEANPMPDFELDKFFERPTPPANRSRT
jgi:hypothetical protein